ncbi:Mur ligase family protein [Enterococcus pallens]|nr:Mur ligase family protein [Enterococcus pallens]
MPMFRPTNLTFTKNQLTSKRIDGNRCAIFGTMHLLLYYQILTDLQNEVLSPEQTLRFSSEAAKEYGAMRSTKGQAGEVRLVTDVLNQAISFNAPDCIVALFEVYGGWENTQRKLNQLARTLGISNHSRVSPTGRKETIQLSNVYDYYKIGVAFLSLERRMHAYVKNRRHTIHGIRYEPQGVNEGECIVSSIYWGTDRNNCLLFLDKGEELEGSLVINGETQQKTTQLALGMAEVKAYEPLLEASQAASYVDWLTQRFDGYFLNEQIAAGLEVEHVSMDESYIRNSHWEKVAFIALSASNFRSLVPSSKRTFHMNEQVKKSPLLEAMSVIITDKPIEELKEKIPQYIVPDSLLFAYQYASYMSEAYQGKFIPITGSAGKSSTRLMLSHLLENTGKIFENYGNVNLHYPTFGLSLEINSTYDFALFEAAGATMNALSYGNNAYIWQAKVAIITSFGTAHAADGIDRNLFVKKQLFFGVKEGGYAVINGDIEENYLTPILDMAKSLNLTILLYSLKQENVACFVEEKNVLKDRTEIRLSLMNKEISFSLKTDSDGQIQNAMAALLAIECLGYPAEKYAEKLFNFQSFDRILRPLELKLENKKVTVVDDTHNSSIESAINGIHYFTKKKQFYSGTSLLVLGETAGLGAQTQEQHRRLEPAINASSADKIIFYGEPFKGLEIKNDQVVQCETKDQVVQEIKQALTEDSYVFVKGSHGIGFYEVIDQLKQEANFIKKEECE